LMFIPSLGVCMLFAVLLSRVMKSESTTQALTDFNSFFSMYKKPVLTVFVIVILFGVKTMARNAEWKEDDILYATDVKKAGDSAHLLFYVANNISSDDHLASLPDSAARMKARNEGIDYLTRALKILPKYADAYQRRGFIYNQIKETKKAEADYREGLIHNPTHPILYNNFGTLCFEQQRYEEAKFYFQQAIKYNPQYAHALNNLASVYGVFGMGEAAQIQADPANASVHTKMSQENYASAIEYFKRSIKADREFGEPYRLLAITYRNTGQIPEAEQYERLFKEVMQKANAKN
jgi:Tfp pilus assembly protein PilF